MSAVLLIAELRSAARYAGLSLADRAADRIEELEEEAQEAARVIVQMQARIAELEAQLAATAEARWAAFYDDPRNAGREQPAPAPGATQPVAVFDGYIDGGAAVIQWREKALPAGTLLYAAPVAK